MHRLDDGCFHGGAFFEAIGDHLNDLWRRERIVNADVLDAWFPPAPSVLAGIVEHLDWLARTSPPTTGAGMRAAIAVARGLPEGCVLPHAGSSALIYLAMREWLDAGSRVLLLDPCYGEYAHVFEQVVGCSVDRVPLWRSDGYRVDLDDIGRRLARGYDLFVLVNPNNPTGQLVSRHDLERLVARASPRTRLWIDEAYIDYVDGAQSMESIAVASGNVFVCKSLSKVYALSGLRSAYLVGNAADIGKLRRLTPPWAVSLPAQLASVRALQEPVYYRARYRETDALRTRLRGELERLPGLAEVSGSANFLLCHLDEEAPAVESVLERCRRDGIYLRNVANMGRALGSRVFRTAVKDASANDRILASLRSALSPPDDRSRPAPFRRELAHESGDAR